MVGENRTKEGIELVKELIVDSFSRVKRFECIVYDELRSYRVNLRPQSSGGRFLFVKENKYGI